MTCTYTYLTSHTPLENAVVKINRCTTYFFPSIFSRPKLTPLEPPSTPATTMPPAVKLRRNATTGIDRPSQSSPLTDVEIISLAHQHNPTSSELPPFLLTETSHSILLSFLHSRAAAAPNPSSAVAEYISSLLSLISRHPSSALSSFLPALLHSYLSLFTSHTVPHDHNSLSTLHQFVFYLDTVEIREIPKVIDSITSYIPQINYLEDAHVLSLLPKCIELVRISNEVDNPAEYVSSVTDALIKCEWTKEWCKLCGIFLCESIK